MEEGSEKQPKKSPVVAIVVAVIAVIIVGAGIAFALSGSNDDSKDSSTAGTETAASDSGCTDETGKTDVTLTYDANENFVPNCVTVDAGTTITYKNDSDFSLDVGADPHPTHSGNRDVSHQEFELPVEPNGGTATAVMEKTGKSGLHNHDNSSATATIVVQ